LPDPPWKHRSDARVAESLGIKPVSVYQAIQRLIKSGKRFHQGDGVFFDKNKDILAIDADRVESVYKVGNKYYQ
jgi:hypothetical protein